MAACDGGGPCVRASGTTCTSGVRTLRRRRSTTCRWSRRPRVALVLVLALVLLVLLALVLLVLVLVMRRRWLEVA